MIHICPIFQSLFNMSKVVEQERGNFWTDQIFRVGAGALPNIYCLPASKTREYVLKFEIKNLSICIFASQFGIYISVDLQTGSIGKFDKTKSIYFQKYFSFNSFGWWQRREGDIVLQEVLNHQRTRQEGGGRGFAFSIS